MLDLISRMPRGNIFASPGTGKTSATLMSLAALSVADDNVFPVLVVAPKRVANMVWTDEAAMWDQLKALRVVKILGTPAQRIAALKSKADVYTINYENLKWLHETLDGKWPFKTVICDESTRIKNHRTHYRSNPNGTFTLAASRDNAGHLVRHAKECERWYNLTGTPAANGLTDLWGQQWPIDFGKSLKRTYSQFTIEWFRIRPGTKPEHQIFDPLKGAKEEIADLLRPYSTVVDAYDYFDITKPIERNVKFELPETASKQYRKMRREAVLELETSGVTAANAGSALMKCRQIASGCVKDDDGNWQTLHREKIACVDEVLESIGNENLVIAYWFQHDLKLLQESYHDAVLLESNSKQKQIVDDWNAGKIKILLIHAQSAGHGLSLQHGGRHLCIFTPDWNAEYYAQVIERLGPVRQAQSGYKRMVYIHRIMAKDTCEEAIADRQSNKLSLDAAVRKAVGLCP